MKIINYEFKAKANDIDLLEYKLQQLNPLYKGEDHQIDTYFNVTDGRLKMREGNIENALIYYNRPDTAEAKQSDVLLYSHTNSPALKQILERLHGIKVVIDKVRRIYYLNNVKFHFDSVYGLGTFVEVEAQSAAENADIAALKEQCDYFALFFGIKVTDYIHLSYSDLLLQKNGQ